MKKKSIILQLLHFEISSWYGRHFKNNNGWQQHKGHIPLLLDLGVGLNYTEDWINADFYRLPHIKFWKKYAERPKVDLELDLRYPLPFDADNIDGIYSGHTIEHLKVEDVKFLFSEMFRILKPGCWVRINVPDLKKYVDFYCGISKNIEFDQFKTGCEAIHSLTQNWGHLSCWDFDFLNEKLVEAGFINVKEVQFGVEGKDVRLIKEEKIREWETLVVEAQKPIK